MMFPNGITIESFGSGAMGSLESEELEVQQVNEQFYRAFESLDIREMQSLWAVHRSVKCVHPGWGLRTGWPSVRDSWVMIFNNTAEIRFELSDVDICIVGDTGWVTCVEHVTTLIEGEPQANQILATNIFIKDKNRWLLLHHHGSPIFMQGDG
jgi:ketosteroid isomerase-like protein